MKCRQDRTWSIQVGLLLFSVFIIVSDSSLRETHVSRRYYSNNRTIMNLEKKSCSENRIGQEVYMLIYKHSCQSCKCNDLKESEPKVHSKSS